MAAESPENVLFVIMDIARKDHLTPYGYDRPTAPGFDRFADEATVFEQAVTSAPWMLPVHASLFTGMYPSQHGANQESPYLEGATTLTETFSAAGYGTACYSSNAWITPYTYLTDGFAEQDNFFEVMPGESLSGPLAKAWKTMNDSDAPRMLAGKLVSPGNIAHEYLVDGEGADSKTSAVVDQTIDSIDDSEEFFAFINLMDAHLPYHSPEEYKERFAPGVDSTEVYQNSKEYNAGAYETDNDEWGDICGSYDAEIAHIDDQPTRLLDHLKETGRWDDTMVVVCADHGEFHGEHGLYGHEFCLYDPLINVPLMVKHPDLDVERRGDQVELVDLYHTVLNSLGVEGGEPVTPSNDAVGLDHTYSLLSTDHREFAQSSNDNPGQRRDGQYTFVEYFHPVVELKQLEEKASSADITLPEDSRFYSRMRAARRTDAKYVRIDRVPDEAYRIGDDPEEIENVVDADTDSEAIAETKAALAEFKDAIGGAWTDALDTDVSDDSVDQMDDEVQDRLRDLGYFE